MGVPWMRVQGAPFSCVCKGLFGAVSLQGVFMILSHVLRGNGSRFLALLFATISIFAIIMLPAVEPASAADGEKLYCIPKGSSKLIEYTGGGNPTDIGIYKGLSYQAQNTAAVIGGQNLVIDPSTCTSPTNAGDIDKRGLCCFRGLGCGLW